jgi:hypothetical protein
LGGREAGGQATLDRKEQQKDSNRGGVSPPVSSGAVGGNLKRFGEDGAKELRLTFFPLGLLFFPFCHSPALSLNTKGYNLSHLLAGVFD